MGFALCACVCVWVREKKSHVGWSLHSKVSPARISFDQHYKGKHNKVIIQTFLTIYLLIKIKILFAFVIYYAVICISKTIRDMESNEYWYSDTVLVNESANNRIGVTMYYGSQRQYAIKASADKTGDNTKQIKSLLKDIRAEKKNVTPVHGCTHYL